MPVEIGLLIIVIVILLGVFFTSLNQVLKMSEQAKLTQKEVMMLEDEINRIKTDLESSNARLKTGLEAQAEKNRKASSP